MASEKLSVAQANLKIALWNAEAEAFTSSHFYEWLQDMGLPEEVVTRLHELVSHTMKLGEKVIAIGKVVLVKIIAFVQAHPFLVGGAGVGAVVGAAIYSMVVSIPFLGQLLEPIARALGFGAVFTGAVVGHGLDKRFKDVGQNIVEIANEFFKLIADVLSAVSYQIVLA